MRKLWLWYTRRRRRRRREGRSDRDILEGRATRDKRTIYRKKKEVSFHELET